jgi:hypothetical protein
LVEHQAEPLKSAASALLPNKSHQLSLSVGNWQGSVVSLARTYWEVFT